MSAPYASVNHADIEARARQLRAEAARHGILTVRNAIANAFSALTLRSTVHDAT